MAELALICNSCLQYLEPKQQAVATCCQHLYCLECARKIVDSGEGCPQCDHTITKSNIKLVNVMHDPGPLKLALCGQSPDVALSSALTSIQFWNTQQELQSQLTQQMLQKKIDKVQAACKRKLEEVHNGYVAAKRKYDAEVQKNGVMGRDIQELQQKYNQKASQAKKLGELLKQAHHDNSNLKGRLGLGGPGNARSMSPLGHGTVSRGGQLVTTVQKTAVFGTLADMSPTANTGMLGHHQGHHPARPLQQLAAGGRTNSAAAAFMGGVLEPVLSPPMIGAAARRRSGVFNPNGGGGLQGLLGGHGGGGGGGNSGGSHMMNNLGLNGQQQSARAFFNGSPSGMVSL